MFLVLITILRLPVLQGLTPKTIFSFQVLTLRCNYTSFTAIGRQLYVFHCDWTSTIRLSLRLDVNYTSFTAIGRRLYVFHCDWTSTSDSDNTNSCSFCNIECSLPSDIGDLSPYLLSSLCSLVFLPK